jgi:hypothetical protein
MILAFDMTNSDSAHVPINAALLRAMALSGQRVRMHADPSHLAALGSVAGVECQPMPLSPLYRWKTHIVSLRRFRHEWQAMRRALRAAPGGPHLVVLLSATPTAILAALLLSPRILGIQVALHGNLNEITGWQPRNPITRRFDLAAMLCWRDARLRFLVFEDAIRDGLRALLPEAAGRTDVLPHPADTTQTGAHPYVPLGVPLRVALVGMATEAKGLGAFLDTARSFRARYGSRVEFHIVGGRSHTVPAERFADIAHEVAIGHVSRGEFTARLAAMHYVFLPLQPGYYSLSPSGGLMDAVAWAKPVIASRVPITEGLFEQGGDIGHLADDVPGMQAALEQVLAQMDTARHAAQSATLQRLAASRQPQALAAVWRGIIERGFPAVTAMPCGWGSAMARRDDATEQSRHKPQPARAAPAPRRR